MKCDSCGAPIENGKCTYCGEVVQDPKQPGSAPPNQTGAAKKPMNKKLRKCKTCGAEIATHVQRCPQCGAKNKKPFFRKWWFWAIVIFIVFGSVASQKDGSNAVPAATPTPKNSAVESSGSGTNSSAPEEPTAPAVEGVSAEFQSALEKANIYSYTMRMSKAGIYNQLTSEYGEQFPADAAQYAIDHLEADYKANALAKAETYSKTMYMSQASIYSQLVSENGENFTEEEAQYAVDNLNADYNANALAKAKTYQSTMSMSKSAIYDQLVSEYGEQFTAEQAQYAIDNLE